MEHRWSTWPGTICRDDFPKAILGKHGEYNPSKAIRQSACCWWNPPNKCVIFLWINAEKHIICWCVSQKCHFWSLHILSLICQCVTIMLMQFGLLILITLRHDPNWFVKYHKILYFGWRKSKCVVVSSPTSGVVWNHATFRSFDGKQLEFLLGEIPHVFCQVKNTWNKWLVFLLIETSNILLGEIWCFRLVKPFNFFSKARSDVFVGSIPKIPKKLWCHPFICMIVKMILLLLYYVSIYMHIYIYTYALIRCNDR